MKMLKKLMNESTLKGTLHKRDPNGLIKGWKRRWFWLMDGRLYYSKDDAEKIPISFISLRTVTSIGVATSMKFSLFINTPGRTYHLKAGNTSEMQHWINELSIAKLMMDVELSKDAHGDDRFMKTGWMIKRGQIMKNWKRRFFHLRGGILYYYKTEFSRAKRGKIPLLNALIAEAPTMPTEHEKLHCFEIITKKRTWYFKVEEKLEAEHWLLCIKRQKAIIELRVASLRSMTYVPRPIFNLEDYEKEINRDQHKTI